MTRMQRKLHGSTAFGAQAPLRELKSRTAHAEKTRAQSSQREFEHSVVCLPLFNPCSFRCIREIRDKVVQPGPLSSANSAPSFDLRGQFNDSSARREAEERRYYIACRCPCPNVKRAIHSYSRFMRSSWW